MKKRAETVSEYIASAPKWAQSVLKELRKIIKTSAPKAKESISYHMPYYSQNGRLAYFAAYTNHCSFHWISAQDKKDFAKELANQKVVGSTLHIPKGEKVPSALIKKIIRTRIKNNEARRKRE
jgi:uncharacterized protein YdhG (YjbR/CyaY superfamily)